MRELVRRFRSRDDGEGLVEYAVIIAMVAICLMGVLKVARNVVGGTMKSAATEVARSSSTSYGASAGSVGPLPGGEGDPPLADDPGKDAAADSAAADEPSADDPPTGAPSKPWGALF
jgi:Flp pilus assembly pilin Flp